ncbi:MAG: hemolysin family protein [Chloroflexi bacterium]|nr:hemolysin family protein [Chloroflexota bacterium]
MVFLGLIAINGLFAGAQFALVAVDRYEVETAAARGARRDRTVRRGLETLSFQLSGAQLGITVSSLVLGFVVDNAIGPLLRPALAWIPGIENGTLVALTAALALVLATVIQMVLGELGPKNLAIARPMATARLFVPPAMFVNTVFSPVIRLLNAMANASMRAVGLVPREELEGFQSLEEMHEALRWAAHENTIEGVEYEVLDRALGLGRTNAGDVMVPRSQVIAISSTANLADLARKSLDTGYSRFPIRDADGREFVGIAHVKDVLALPAPARAATPVSTKAQQALVVPTARDLRSLLLEMQAAQHAMVIVHDEFGQAAGIVTLEDIVEELLGSIEDEYDKPEPMLVTPLDGGAYDVAARIRRDELSEATGFEMPEGRFETLAGLVVTLLQRIPATGDAVSFRGWTFRVTAMDGRRIDRIRMERPGKTRRSVA